VESAVWSRSWSVLSDILLVGSEELTGAFSVSRDAGGVDNAVGLVTTGSDFTGACSEGLLAVVGLTLDFSVLLGEPGVALAVVVGGSGLLTAGELLVMG
jgi:hypothetical protein